jgi:hypothetical protein
MGLTLTANAWADRARAERSGAGATGVGEAG